MLGNQSLEKQTDYSLYSGKLAKQIQDATECATSKIDGVAFHSWHHQKLLTKLLSPQILDMVSYQNPGLMLKKCLPTRLYQYPLIIHSSLNQYKMEWIDQKQNWHIVFPQVNLLGEK